ncbi:hypothetical protein DNI29_19550 [Hymenobacter sediminis]|uniref:DUF5694 domain-containing protein n=1 Tax=Hymenobacter sediminis TaxID=2218621 RepID=UPI000DA67AFA|nr:DUF5694 domain-containing protein [Hymenobacter sediminis]RPD44898.1 hypothetical protein DNI29_19550 [Hymenobacter sediminis]
MFLSKYKRLVLMWLVWCAAATLAVAQKPLEILLVGTSHYNGETDASYRPIIDKLKAYQPDLVIGEYLAPTDARQLPVTQGEARPYQRCLRYLQRRELQTPPLSTKAAAAVRRRLRKNPQLHQQRIDLARYYAYNYDRANAEYQLYLLEETYKGRLSAADQTYYRQAFGPADSLRKVLKMVRPLTEYHRIFFPLLQELGQDQLASMDCQRYGEAFSRASSQTYGQFLTLQAAFKADSTTEQAATFRRINAAKTAYFAYLDAANTSEQAYRIMNAPAFGKLNDDLNFYGDEALFGAPGFPTAAVQAMKTQWQLRNQGMCDNIVRRAREQKAHRVVVAVGSAHTMIMHRMLAAMPHVRVSTYNDLP